MKQLFFLFCCILFSCSIGEQSIPELSGEYVGEFTVRYNSDGEEHSNPVLLTFSNGSYTSTSSPDYFPAGGSGDYEVQSSTIKFEDKNFWSANFDWHLVLGGEYRYTLNGDELTLTKENQIGRYVYQVTKQ